MTAPLLMLPFRLETHFDEDVDGVLVVRVRAYPDQIHIASRRAGLSPGEADALARIENAPSPADREAAEAALARLTGRPRARDLIASQVAGDLPPTDAGDWSGPPVARCLPARLVYRVEMAGDRRIELAGEPIPDNVQMGPGAEGDSSFTGGAGDPLLWMTSFEAAREIGLAATLRLAQARNFRDVKGVSVIGEPRSDGADSKQLATLLADHAGDGGLVLIPPGTATKGFDRAVPHLGTDSFGLAQALGVDPALIEGSSGDAARLPCHRIVWEALIRPALLEGWAVLPGDGAADTAWIDNIESEFVGQVLPSGAFPPLAVAAQAYGIHVMEPPEGRAEDAIGRILGDALPIWAEAGRRHAAEATAIGAWQAVADALSWAPASVAWRRRRVHPALAWINFVLASTANTSGRAPFDALERRREKLDTLAIGPVEDALAGLSMAADAASALLPEALFAPDSNDETGPVGVPGLDGIADRPLEELFSSHLPSNATSVLHMIGVSALRWALLEMATAEIVGDDAAEMASQMAWGGVFVERAEGWQTRLVRGLGQDALGTSLAEVVAGWRPVSRTGKRAKERGASILEAIDALARLPAGQVTRALAGSLDAAAVRLDAWAVGRASRRLEQARQDDPTGIAIGAFGWLEGDGRWPGPADPAIYRLAPSVDHAATAAILQEGFEAFSEEGAGPLAELDLSSAQAARGLDLAERLRAGADPEEAMGALARDLLASIGRSDLADDLARAHPLRGESAAATQVADGALLLERARDGTLGALALETEAGRTTLGATLGEGLALLQNRLTATADAYGDLCVAEGLHAWVGNRPDASRAAFEALAGGGPPPARFDVVEPQLRHARLRFSIAIAADETGTEVTGGLLDRAVPALSRVAAGLIGPVAGTMTCRILRKDQPDETHQVDIADLGINPLDAIRLLPPGPAPLPALRPLLAAHLAATGARGVLADTVPDREAEDWFWSVGRAAALVTAARPLRAGDMPGAETDPSEESAEEIAQRGAAGAALSSLLTALSPGESGAIVQMLAVVGRMTEAEGLATALLEGGAPAEDAIDPALAARDALTAREPAELWRLASNGLRVPGLFDPADSPWAGRIDATAGPDPASWVEDIQRAVPDAEPLADLMLAGADLRLDAEIWQGQAGRASRDGPQGWIAGQMDPNAVSGLLESLLLWRTGAGVGPVRGLIVAGWTEALAAPDLDLGLATRVRVPPGRAANALVLAAPSERGWQVETLWAMLGELRDQIAARSVDLSSLPGTSPPARGEPAAHNAGLFLPLLWLPPPPVDDPEFQ